MDRQIREIYNNLMQNKETDEVSRLLRTEVLNMITSEKEKMQKSEYELYRDKAFDIAATGEEAGFIRGFRYAFELFLEVLGV